ncbi:hypothetical protein PR048_004961 [Dryococelus australis]|uniref:Uncharacterized protein n=1 Tax=Dryococelus australis TaxID=614101 RepID=A0ABQ9I6W1_9NEOP|nr:hypothetical protein PR048_004961 [Dryococelus australis]
MCVLLSPLEEENGIWFENVYLYPKSLEQPKYQQLEKVLQAIGCMGYLSCGENKAVLPPIAALPSSIFAFDGIAYEKHNCIQEYLSMGRDAKVECMYVSQTHSYILKQLLHDNTNMLVLFHIDDKNFRHFSIVFGPYDGKTSMDFWRSLRTVPYIMGGINRDSISSSSTVENELQHIEIQAK